MKANYRLKTLSTLVIVVLITASCAARQAYKKGHEAEVLKDYETAMEHYRQALEQNPADIEYKLKFEQARFAAAFQRFQEGRRALARGDLAVAKTEFEKAAKLDPTHDFAQKELADVEQLLKSRAENQPPSPISFENSSPPTRPMRISALR